MILNYLRTAFRNLRRNSIFTAINVFGLSVGISAFILLFLYVNNELTFDRFHKNKANIYRICENDLEYTKGLLLNRLLEDYPEIRNGSRFLDWPYHMVSFDNKDLMQGITLVDTGFFRMFTFPFIKGNPYNAIDKKNTVVISRKIANIYFGDQDPVGKTLDVDFGKHGLLVTGVFEDIPVNSSIKFDMAVSHETGFELDPWLAGVHDWYNTFSRTYIMLDPKADPENVENMVQKEAEDHFITGKSKLPRINFLPLVALHDKLSDNKSFIIILIFIAIGVILIASINFINLSTASSLKRAPEIAMRKTFGAKRKHMVRQFLGESLTISFMALLVALVLSELLLPVFNRMFETSLTLNMSSGYVIIPVLVGLWLFSGLLSGLIPAWRLSRFKIIPSLRKEATSGKKAGNFRSGLVIFQLSLSIILIAGTFMMKKQIYFMKHHALNFDKDNVLIVRTNTWQYRDKDAAVKKFRVILDELRNDTRVESFAISEIVPGDYIENYNNFYPESWSDVESLNMRQGFVSRDYFKTYGISFAQGNPYEKDFVLDSNAVVINKTALDLFRAGSIIGENIHGNSRSGIPYKIVGVVNDFYYMGLQHKIQPILQHISDEKNLNLGSAKYISLRVKPGQMNSVLGTLKKKWLNTGPAQPLDFFFADEEINKDYRQFERINSVVGYFSLLAVIVASLGLFALTIFISRQRIKEIGIRKVNGAKTKEVMFMLNRDFVKWVGIAFVIACPVAWYGMDMWLESFAYKTSLSWWIFGLAGLLTLFVALLTVSVQSWRAATRNPVEALRYE